MNRSVLSSNKLHALAASLLLVLLVVCFNTNAGAQKKKKQPAQTTTQPQQQGTPAAQATPQARRKNITPLRGGDAAQGSRVTVTSDVPLNDYSAYRSGDRYYVVIPEANAPGAQSMRGRGYEDVQVQKRGSDAVISFKLQPGTAAHVNQKFNRLEVVFDAPGAKPAGSTTTGANAGNSNTSQTPATNTGANNSQSPATNARPTPSPNNAATQATGNQAIDPALNKNPLTQPPAALASPGVTQTTGESALTPLNPSLTPEAASPAPSVAPSAEQIAQVQTAPTVPSAITTNVTQPSSSVSLGAALARNWLVLVLAGLILLSIVLFVVMRPRATENAVPPHFVREIEDSKAQKALVEDAEPDLAASSIAEQVLTPAMVVPTTMTDEVLGIDDEQTLVSDENLETTPLLAEAEEGTGVERLESEVENLLAGQPYDEAVVSATDSGTRGLIAAFLITAMTGADAERRERARAAFIKHDYLEEETRSLRTAHSHGVRVSAARNLGLVADTSVTPHLVAALEDQSKEVRSAAVAALSEVRDPAAIAPLQRLLEREKNRKKNKRIEPALIRRAIESSAAVAVAEEEETPTPVAATPAPEVIEDETQPVETAPEILAPQAAAVDAETTPALFDEAQTQAEIEPAPLASEPLINEFPVAASLFTDDESATAVMDETEAARRAEEEEAARQQFEEEERRRVEEETRQREEAETARREAAEAAARLRQEAEAREREEAEAQLRTEEESRLRAEAETARQRALEEARLRAEEEERKREEEDARLRAEASARQRAEEEAAQQRQAEAARLQAEEEAARQRALEEERERELEEARFAEQSRLAEEARLAEQSRLAEEARIAEETRLAEEARIAEEARLAEEVRVAEEARLAEEIRLAEEARVAEEARLAEETRLAEEARVHAEAEARRVAEEHAAYERELEEARLRAEEESRQRAEEEARQLAEEEVRLHAQAEAQRLAAEESWRQAEAEASRSSFGEIDLGAFSEVELAADAPLPFEAEVTEHQDIAQHAADPEISFLTPIQEPFETSETPQGDWFDIDIAETPELSGQQARESVSQPYAFNEEAVAADPPLENIWSSPLADEMLTPAIQQSTQPTTVPEASVTAPPAKSPAGSSVRDIELAVTDKGMELVEEDLSMVPTAILRRLGSDVATVRAAAIADLSRLGGEEAFREITGAFDDPVQIVRDAAARSLYGLDTDRAASFTRALREATPERRRNIGEALSSSGLAAEAIGNLMGESREKTYDAFSLLFLMSKAGEVRPLMRAIEEHPNNEVRLAVVKLLALSGQQEILPAFRRLAVRGSLPTEVRSAVMEAIYQLSSQTSSDTSSVA